MKVSLFEVPTTFSIFVIKSWSVPFIVTVVCVEPFKVTTTPSVAAVPVIIEE